MCEGRKVNLKTGNLVVDAVGKMNFVGNVIPENWFKTIVTASGKVHLLAIFILVQAHRSPRRKNRRCKMEKEV